MRAAFVGDPLSPADPRAANRDPQATLAGGCPLDRRRDRVLVGHVRRDEGRVRSQLRRQRLALLGV